METHLSATAINQYLECGLYYKFARIDKLKPAFKNAGLALGTCIHKTLAEFHQEALSGELFTLEQFTDTFESYWKQATQANEIRYEEGKDYQTLLQEGKDLLTLYFNSFLQDTFTVIAVEEPFEFHLENLNVPIKGRLDLVEEDELGTIIITDFKTSKRAYSTDEVDRNIQLTIYNMAAQVNGYKDREILLKIDCLVKTKTPKMEQYYTTRSQNDQNAAVKKINHIFDAIQKQVFIPNDTSWKCKTCEYKAYCEEWMRRE